MSEAELEKLIKAINDNNSNSASLKEKKILQQKMLHDLINKYKSQALFYDKNQRQTLNRNSSLPVLSYQTNNNSNAYTLSIPHQSLSEMNSAQVSSRTMMPTNQRCELPKAKVKARLESLKELAVKKKKTKAKSHKNAMIILSDNVKVYKEQIRKENINKRQLVSTKKKLIFDSIVNYKKQKKDLLNNLNWCDIKELTKANEKKMQEKEYWKTKMNKNNSFKPKFCMFPLFLTQKLKLK